MRVRTRKSLLMATGEDVSHTVTLGDLRKFVDQATDVMDGDMTSTVGVTVSKNGVEHFLTVRRDQVL